MTTDILSPASPPARSTAALQERLLGILNGGGLALMISIGHRTGLFDRMASRPPSTSRDLAAAAGLDERYVREWLHAMTVGRLVDHDPVAGTFELPVEHAALLTRAAAPDNMAVSMQWVGVLAGAEDAIVDCFRKGGGVPYEQFHRFHDAMAEESDQTVIAGLFEHILPLAPGLVDRLRAGVDVVDVGCGRGRALLRLAEAFPASRFTGFDLSESALAWARDEAALCELANVRFEARDLTGFDAPARFDVAFAFDAIHDQKDPQSVLDGVARALRPGGLFLMQDIGGSSRVEKNLDHPLAPFLYTISTLHCMSVSLAQGGAGLGTLWGEELAAAMLESAGFTHTELHRLPHDIMNVYYVARVS